MEITISPTLTEAQRATPCIMYAGDSAGEERLPDTTLGEIWDANADDDYTREEIAKALIAGETEVRLFGFVGCYSRLILSPGAAH